MKKATKAILLILAGCVLMLAVLGTPAIYAVCIIASGLLLPWLVCKVAEFVYNAFRPKHY